MTAFEKLGEAAVSSQLVAVVPLSFSSPPLRLEEAQEVLALE
jgi:hypothetical protein